MSWRDGLRRVKLADGRELVGASFRGIPFFVEVSDRTGGRRTVTHEFPGRDEPFVDDMGRRARVFTVEGYVVGADYVRDRDALLGALEDVAGPGRLVHPYHGVKQAICSGLTVRESRADGGMAVLQLEFTEAPPASAPTEEPDLAEQVDESADEALAAVEEELAASYDASGLPAFAVESVADTLAAAAGELEEALAGVTTTTQEAARLSAEVKILSQQASSLVRQPSEAVEALLSALGALSEAVIDAPRPVLRALLDVASSIEAPAALGTTATREREHANQVAFAAALRRILVVEAARLAAVVDYATLEDASADSDDIAALLDEEAAEAGNTAYPALVRLRARVTRAVPGDAALARVLTVERRVSTPSLLLAYQLYGSVELEADIIARNRVRHPGFLSGELRVLSHD